MSIDVHRPFTLLFSVFALCVMASVPPTLAAIIAESPLANTMSPDDLNRALQKEASLYSGNFIFMKIGPQQSSLHFLEIYWFCSCCSSVLCCLLSKDSWPFEG
jgi:hypothetical protein